MLASRGYTIVRKTRCWEQCAGRTHDASSSRSMRPPTRRSRSKRWSVLSRSIGSKRRSAVNHPMNVAPLVRHEHYRATNKAACLAVHHSAQASRKSAIARNRPQSATCYRTGRHYYVTARMAASRSITTSLNARCIPSPWGEKTISSAARTPVVKDAPDRRPQGCRIRGGAAESS